MSRTIGYQYLGGKDPRVIQTLTDDELKKVVDPTSPIPPVMPYNPRQDAYVIAEEQKKAIEEKKQEELKKAIEKEKIDAEDVSTVPAEPKAPVKKPEVKPTPKEENLMSDEKQAKVSFDKSDFPVLDSIIGLPPGYTVDQYAGVDFNIQDQMESEFPILTIEPMIFELKESDGIFPYIAEKVGIQYQIAVMPNDTQISFTHSNEYKPSAITKELQDLMTFGPMGDIRQLSHVMGGPLGDAMRYAGQTVQTGMDNMLESISHGISKNIEAHPILRQINGIGNDVLRAMLLGARSDFPNIWQNSGTGMTQSFTVHLRTFATDPDDKVYIQQIIDPLSAFLSLSLPKGGDVMSYIEPPYIYAHLPNVFEYELAGINNLTWNIPLSTLNLKGIPRHIQISFSISNLYNVMVQGGVQLNKEMPTKDKFLDNLRKKPKKKVANEAVWKNEFGDRKQGRESDSITKGILPTDSPIQKAGLMGSSVGIDFGNMDIGKAIGTNIGTNMVNLNMNSLGLGNFKLPDLGNFNLMDLPITDIVGDLNLNGLLNGLDLNLDLNSSMFDLDIKGIDTDPFGKALTNWGVGLHGSLMSSLQGGAGGLSGIFGNGNLSNMTNGILGNLQIPNNLLGGLSNAVTGSFTDILTSIDVSKIDLSNSLNLVTNAVKSVPIQLTNLIQQGKTGFDNVLNGVVNTITKVSPALDGVLRLSKPLQETLHRTADALTSELNKIDVVSEMQQLNNFVLSKIPSAAQVSTEFQNAIQKVCDVTSGVVQCKTLETSLKMNQNRTNSSRCMMKVTKK